MSDLMKDYIHFYKCIQQYKVSQKAHLHGVGRYPGRRVLLKVLLWLPFHYARPEDLLMGFATVSLN